MRDHLQEYIICAEDRESKVVPFSFCVLMFKELWNAGFGQLEYRFIALWFFSCFISTSPSCAFCSFKFTSLQQSITSPWVRQPLIDRHVQSAELHCAAFTTWNPYPFKSSHYWLQSSRSKKVKNPPEYSKKELNQVKYAKRKRTKKKTTFDGNLVWKNIHIIIRFDEFRNIYLLWNGVLYLLRPYEILIGTIGTRSCIRWWQPARCWYTSSSKTWLSISNCARCGLARYVCIICKTDDVQYSNGLGRNIFL